MSRKSNAVRVIESNQAAIVTASVQVQVITINNKQMTLAVFRQLPEVFLSIEKHIADGVNFRENLKDMVWGYVRYDGIWHVVEHKGSVAKMNVYGMENYKISLAAFNMAIKETDAMNGEVLKFFSENTVIDLLNERLAGIEFWRGNDFSIFKRRKGESLGYGKDEYKYKIIEANGGELYLRNRNHELERMLNGLNIKSVGDIEAAGISYTGIIVNGEDEGEYNPIAVDIIPECLITAYRKYMARAKDMMTHLKYEKPQLFIAV